MHRKRTVCGCAVFVQVCSALHVCTADGEGPLTGGTGPEGSGSDGEGDLEEHMRIKFSVSGPG